MTDHNDNHDIEPDWGPLMALEAALDSIRAQLAAGPFNVEPRLVLRIGDEDWTLRLPHDHLLAFALAMSAAARTHASRASVTLFDASQPAALLVVVSANAAQAIDITPRGDGNPPMYRTIDAEKFARGLRFRMGLSPAPVDQWGPFGPGGKHELARAAA